MANWFTLIRMRTLDNLDKCLGGYAWADLLGWATNTSSSDLHLLNSPCPNCFPKFWDAILQSDLWKVNWRLPLKKHFQTPPQKSNKHKDTALYTRFRSFIFKVTLSSSCSPLSTNDHVQNSAYVFIKLKRHAKKWGYCCQLLMQKWPICWAVKSQCNCRFFYPVPPAPSPKLLGWGATKILLDTTGRVGCLREWRDGSRIRWKKA